MGLFCLEPRDELKKAESVASLMAELPAEKQATIKKEQNNRERDAEGAAAEWHRMGSLAPPRALLKLLVKNAFFASGYQR